MNQLTDQEIAKVFAMYLYNKIINVDTKLKYILNPYQLNYIKYFNEGAYKLLLKPLPSISDEDAVEVAKIYWVGNKFNNTYVYKAAGGRYVLDRYILKGDPQNVVPATNIYFLIQYLISKGYDVPQWFGIDHWANGKFLIELGVAIEKQ